MERHTERPIESYGARLRAARERQGLTQAQLASRINGSQVLVSQWEGDKTRPRPSSQLLLARELGLAPSETLIAYLDEYTDPSHPQVREKRAMVQIDAEVAAALSAAVSMELTATSKVGWVIAARSEEQERVRQALESALPLFSRLVTGREMRAGLETLKVMLAIAEELDGVDGRRVLFDLADKAAHLVCFLAEPAEVERMARPFLRQMLNVAAGGTRTDQTLLRRYHARQGDALKIAGAERPASHRAALEHLRLGNEFRGDGILWFPGYHAVRSLAAAAAEVEGRAEYNATYAQVFDVIHSGRLTEAELAHVFEGLVGADLRRHVKHPAEPGLRRRALDNYSHAVRQSARAEEVEGRHEEFALRLGMARYQFFASGIYDFLEGKGVPVEAEINEMLNDLIAGAQASGNPRLLARLTEALRQRERSL
ncbi:MAG: multiprotein-bridging factor 1 family protein [Vicinamibacterales bacterium]